MSRQRDKAGWTGDTDRKETWAEFDALPVGVKRLYWSAPFSYTAAPAYRAWREGLNMRRYVERALDGFAADVARESERVYGEAQIGWLA